MRKLKLIKGKITFKTSRETEIPIRFTKMRTFLDHILNFLQLLFYLSLRLILLSHVFFKTSHQLRTTSASSWVRFGGSCLTLLGEGSILKQCSTTRKLEMGKGTGELKLGKRRGCKVCSFSSCVIERLRLARWDTAFMILSSQCPASSSSVTSSS